MKKNYSLEQRNDYLETVETFQFHINVISFDWKWNNKKLYIFKITACTGIFKYTIIVYLECYQDNYSFYFSKKGHSSKFAIGLHQWWTKISIIDYKPS